jgi:hypothetical protein
MPLLMALAGVEVGVGVVVVVGVDRMVVVVEEV